MKKRAAKSDFLGELLGKKNTGPFFRTVWPGEPMVNHGPLTRLRFAGMRELESPAALAKNWQGRIMAWSKPGTGLPGIDATSDQAPVLYDVGYTLFFPHVQAQVPAIRALTEEFADAVGVSKQRVSCEVFFSKEGSGAPPHFDGYSGFNIQLRGEKQWWLARNEHVQFPITGGAMGQAADPVHYGCARLPFPERMPDTATVVATKPGTVVFVPSGYWHATKATSDDNIAIVFSMNRDPWTEKLTKEIESRLDRRLPLARSSPLLGVPDLYARHEDELAATLAALKKIVSELEAKQLLRQWIARDRPRFAIPASVSIKFLDREAPQWALEVRQGEKVFATKMRRSSAELLYALRRKEPVAHEQLCKKFPSRKADELLRTADELVDIGLLRRVPPDWLERRR